MKKTYKIGGVIAALFTVLLLAAAYIHTHNLEVLNPAGTIASKERHLLVVAVLLMLIVVVPVFVLLFSFAWRYREGNTKAKYSPDFDGSRTFETIWWLIPTALIVALSFLTWNYTHKLDPYVPIQSSKAAVTVDVVALDWKWLFIYPKQHIATVNYLDLPVNTPVNFNITSDTVMNSFWIPQLGGQIYAMTGMSTQLHLMATKDGNYRGSSSNISGAGFSKMIFDTHATSQRNFNAWVADAQSSKTTLDVQHYNQLTKPTIGNKPQYFGSVVPELFDAVMQKYAPVNGGEGALVQ
jgi:cytochrome o ubiquinol oxidase subunit 2